MQFKVYIQENLAGIIEADNTGQALAIVAKKLENTEFTLQNPNQPPNIKLVTMN